MAAMEDLRTLSGSYEGVQYTVWRAIHLLGSRCLGVKSLLHTLLQLLLNAYGIISPENIAFTLRGNTNLAFLIKLLKDKIMQYV